jgi:monothiol glutaredoxin
VKFKGIDVLMEPGIREGIKQFSDWPTIPRLYVKGQYVFGDSILISAFP